MLAYNITVDYSLLVNIPPTNYNNLINKPTITNGINGINGVDGINGTNGFYGITSENFGLIALILAAISLLWMLILTIYICVKERKT